MSYNILLVIKYDKNSQIRLKDVIAIRRGETTKLLEETDVAEDLCFSISETTLGSKTLDFQAKTRMQRNRWLNYINNLWEKVLLGTES